MAVQVGTVDGLINITPVIKDCFVKAIDSFSVNVIKNNKLGDLSIGDAFQRYTYPVYSGQETDFKLESLTKEVTTKTGNKQSPAYVTYCKKMGLLETEGSDLFELTPVGTALKDGQIELHEYAMLYMSKQGIFIDGKYKGNLLEHIANIFKVSSSITTDELLQSIATKYGDSNFQKTRSDIILGALCAAKILSKVNNVYVLAGIAQAQVLNIFAMNGKNIRPAVLDTDQAYADYVGTFKYGLYDLLNEKNLSSFAYLYPNLVKHLQENYKHDSSSLPLQQIFYGAPGTGKSHKVKEVTDSIAKEFVFRTTFHPDSDYSTFVGAYKPTMEYPNNKAYTVGQLIDKLSEIKNTGCTYPCQKFAAKYWYALKQLTATEIKEIISACGFTDSMKVEIDKSIPVGEELAKHNADSKIVYSFVPQAFLKAYVAAWKNPNEKVFLVIEEINRGNCAQIFGDIFQLLDRKDGVSEYPIKADQDIRDYLAKEFAGYDLEANILSGEELVLPANLHIWATMNTSDQSLFPIDSAFKRRWDWKYMPIHDAGENWTIALSDVEYDWWDFVEKINNVIGNMTSSEDKKLGYFFCKACNGKINAETFVNKVVFYLWNDVFKDYELSDKAFQDGEGKLTFNKFYTPSGDANEATIKTLMENMGVSTSDLITEIDEEAVNLSKDDLSALQQKRLDFWTRYLKYVQNNADYMQYFGGRQTPTKNYYCQFHVLQKKGYLCVVIKHKANKLFVKYETMDEQLYNILYSHKAAIQSELGDINLTWEGKVDTRERIDIYAEYNVDFNNEQSIFNLIIDRLLRMREVFDKYLNN